MMTKSSTMQIEFNPSQHLTWDEKNKRIEQEEQWIQTLCQSVREQRYFQDEGGYPFPNRELVNGISWEFLCRLAGVNQGYGHSERETDRDEPSHGGFENEIFAIRPYDWSEPDVLLPNFEHKPSGFKLWWYKYAFRSSTMNYNLSAEELNRLFNLCSLYLGDQIPSPRQPITVQMLIEQLQTHFKGDELVMVTPEFDLSEKLILTQLKKETDSNVVTFYVDALED